MSVVFPAQHLRPVPNVPCGVESFMKHRTRFHGWWFLMYRVELKADFTILKISRFGISWFLMYRVELKARPWFWLWEACKPLRVPNVPCGVERLFQNSL